MSSAMQQFLDVIRAEGLPSSAFGASPSAAPINGGDMCLPFTPDVAPPFLIESLPTPGDGRLNAYKMITFLPWSVLANTGDTRLAYLLAWNAEKNRYAAATPRPFLYDGAVRLGAGSVGETFTRTGTGATTFIAGGYLGRMVDSPTGIYLPQFVGTGAAFAELIATALNPLFSGGMVINVAPVPTRDNVDGYSTFTTEIDGEPVGRISWPSLDPIAKYPPT